MTSPLGDPHFPQVTGVDLPAPDPCSVQSLVVVLDTTPARAWMGVFVRLLAGFRAGRGVDELRVVGRTLVAIGRFGDPRALAGDIKALVHRVSRQCLDERMTRRMDEDTGAAAGAGAGADTTVQRPVDTALRRDLEAIASMPAVPVLLEAVTRATGMRFAAVARVTDDRWTACAVYDLVQFGLRPGQDLALETTICNEIRGHRRRVSFDRASAHPDFAAHRTPAMYGFESYVSVPILRGDGSFFGTLCALDPEPALLDEATLRTLEAFAAMIGRQLESPDGHAG